MQIKNITYRNELAFYTSLWRVFVTIIELLALLFDIIRSTLILSSVFFLSCIIVLISISLIWCFGIPPWLSLTQSIFLLPLEHMVHSYNYCLNVFVFNSDICVISGPAQLIHFCHLYKLCFSTFLYMPGTF